MYATLEGLTEYLGAAPVPMPAQRALDEIEARVLAYIAPRIPTTDTETAVIATAVYIQWAHESSANVSGVATMATAGLSGFTIGKFTAQRGGSVDASGLFPAGLAAAAKATLFNAGLLYRGAVVEC